MDENCCLLSLTIFSGNLVGVKNILSLSLVLALVVDLTGITSKYLE